MKYAVPESANYNFTAIERRGPFKDLNFGFQTSQVTLKMICSTQSKIITSYNLYTKMLLLVVGDIGYPEVHHEI